MSKNTTKQQLQELLSIMETQPDVASGFHKGSKEEQTRFWRKVEVELNSIGPPVKNVTEWKKVWADQKKYVRQKAAQNLKAQKGTGRGQNTQHAFSAFEEGIYNLIGMKESVEGVAATTFGLGSSFTAPRPSSQAGVLAEKNSDPVQQISVTFEEDTAAGNDLTIQVEEDAELHYSKTSVPKKAACKLPNKKYSPSDALEEELQIQKELCGAIKTAVVDLKEHHQNTKKIYRSIDRLHDLQKSHYRVMEDLKLREVEEMKRHNLSMEKMRLREVEDKIEKNRRLLEIEDLKQSAKC